MPALTSRINPRVAATVMFLTNGALAGNLFPRLPQAKDAFAMSDAMFGFAVIAMPVGAMSAAHFPAALLRRYGDRRVVTVGTGLVAIWLTLAGLVMSVNPPGGIGFFILAVAAVGWCDAVVDTAQNAQGLAVQRAMSKPVLMTMHAGWSVGAALGAGTGALAAHCNIAPWLHFLTVGLFLMALVGYVSRSFTLHAPAPDEKGTTSSSWRAVTLLIVPICVALAGFAVEEVGSSWAALFLRTERDVEVGTAGLGAAVLLAAQFVGRLGGDSILGRWGRAGTVKVGMALVLGGLLTVVLVPGWPGWTFLGLALAGLGSAVTVPVAFAVADETPGLPAHSGLAIVGWLMRLSAVVASPLTGMIAATAGLPVGMGVFVIVAAAGMGAALRVQERPNVGASSG